MSIEKTIATYKIVADAGGNCYKFYCDLSGALVCTTKPYKADNPEEELLLAWESEGKEQFNVCHKCGKQVSNAMKIEEPTKPCPACGKPLVYYGKECG